MIGRRADPQDSANLVTRHLNRRLEGMRTAVKMPSTLIVPAYPKRPLPFGDRLRRRVAGPGRHPRRPVVELLEDRTLLASGSTFDALSAAAATVPGSSPLAVPLDDGATASPNGLNPLQV
jgi:hypothetical protein